MSDLPHTFLYRIEECPDLIIDACVADEIQQLILLSLWGRDTAVQELLGRLTLGATEGGLERFQLLTTEWTSNTIAVADVRRLVKRTTRTFERTLFGSMIHAWVFDSRCVNPDKANGSALAILPRDDVSQRQRLWSLVRDTCPLPLLEHWRGTVLDLLHSQGMLSALAFSMGPVEGYRLALDVPVLTAALGDLIRSGTLTVDGEDLAARHS